MDKPDAPVIRVVICDAGPLIHLDQIGCLGLLADFPEVLVPETVWSEVARHRPAVLSQHEVKLTHVRADASQPSGLEVLAKTLALDQGELEALRVAAQRHVDLLLSDDTAARLAAQTLKIPVHGTLGILLRSIRRKQKSTGEVIAILRELPNKSTLHIKASLLNEIIRQIELVSG